MLLGFESGTFHYPMGTSRDWESTARCGQVTVLEILLGKHGKEAWERD